MYKKTISIALAMLLFSGCDINDNSSDKETTPSTKEVVATDTNLDNEIASPGYIVGNDVNNYFIQDIGKHRRATMKVDIYYRIDKESGMLELDLTAGDYTGIDKWFENTSTDSGVRLDFLDAQGFVVETFLLAYLDWLSINEKEMTLQQSFGNHDFRFNMIDLDKIYTTRVRLERILTEGK